MKQILQKMVARLLHQTAEKIEDGSCGLEDDELLEISNMLTHRKMNIEQVCQYYHISRATLNRWQQEGKIPEFRKDSGGKCFLWLDECERAISEYERRADQ